VIGLKPSNILSKVGTMYHGTLSMIPTPRSSDPHTKIRINRKTVRPLDRPPRNKFLWNVRENQRAMVTANTAFINAAINMRAVGRGAAVRNATKATWLMIDPTTK
jgi:hypothetical protein